MVFTRSSGFILEFLQNAEDAGHLTDAPGEFEISFNRKRVKITHNGSPFSSDDVNAICGIRSSKKPEKGTLGYLGIGFKSVFKVTDCPEIYSGPFQFKFDKNAWGNSGAAPWHVMPIWIEKPSEPVASEKTTFIVPFRRKDSYDALLAETKSLKTELFLFLKWMRMITVKDEESGNQIQTLQNLGEDSVGISTIVRNETKKKFAFFHYPCEPPQEVIDDSLTQEYRAGVKKRDICVAFALDGDGNIAPYEADSMYGGVYSFLPLGEEKSGAQFPIQADFLVQPGRESINTEAAWNRWLVDEIFALCKEVVVPSFKAHPKWRYQILKAFEFNTYNKNVSYIELFGPRLLKPLESFLKEDPCVPTIDGWGKPSETIVIDELQWTKESLIAEGLVSGSDLAWAFSGEKGASVAAPKVEAGHGSRLRVVDRRDFLDNHEFLMGKAAEASGPDWFRRLYMWLHRYPKEEKYSGDRREKVTVGYWQKVIVMGSDGKLHKGGEVSLPDIASTDPILAALAKTLLSTTLLLHPAVVAGASKEDEQSIRGFLTRLAGVQMINSEKVCKEAVLPTIQTSSPKPSVTDLLNLTRICCTVLGANDMPKDSEIWVLTKKGEVRAAKEILLPKEYCPEKDWEANHMYLQSPNFASPDYLEGKKEPDDLAAWRQFFLAAGVRESPENGVEVFAMRYSAERLGKKFETVKRVDKESYGYDLEATDSDGTTARIEVKGVSHDQEVELTQNETDKADQYTDGFYLAVVASIPDNPAIYLVRNPAAPGVGKKDKLTIPASTWKTYKLNLP